MGTKTSSNQDYSEIQRLLQRQHTAFLGEIRDRLGNNEFSEKVLLSHLNDQELSYFQEIENAFKRLESGEIGTCVSCEKKIDYRRLKARPITIRCFKCQTLKDEEEKIGLDLEGLNGEGFLSGSFLGRGCQRKRTD